MPRQMKVFLPPWVRWILVPMLALMWGFVTYSAFFTPEGRAEVGLVGWALVTLVLFLIGLMIWLMSSGKLPAYIIESPDDEGERKSR